MAVRHDRHRHGESYSWYLSEAELDQTIDDTQKVDKARIIQLLYFVDDMYTGSPSSGIAIHTAIISIIWDKIVNEKVTSS